MNENISSNSVLGGGSASKSALKVKEYGLKDLTLLKQLREGLLNTKAEVCIERARFVTEYLRDMSSPDEPMETRYAKAVNHFLCNKAPLFFDDILWPAPPRPSPLERLYIRSLPE